MKIKIFITHNVKYNNHNLFYIIIMTYVKFVTIINILKFQFKISVFLNFIKNVKYIINLLFIFFSFICNQKYFKSPLIFYNHDYYTIISSFL